MESVRQPVGCGKARSGRCCLLTHFRATVFLVFLFTALPLLQAADPSPALKRWIAAQEQIQTWSADVEQIRDLKSLAQPLKSEGRVWFASPNRFRWELGNPPQTIAVRTGEELVVVYPRLRRAERYPLDSSRSGPWRDALTLLEAGFPRNMAELLEQYRILEETERPGTHLVLLEPRSPQARKMIRRITIGFSPEDQRLLSTELEFADGSRMRNLFSSPRVNPELPESLFVPPLEPGYEIVEPLSRNRK